jgi:hypothetical protein
MRGEPCRQGPDQALPAQGADWGASAVAAGRPGHPLPSGPIVRAAPAAAGTGMLVSLNSLLGRAALRSPMLASKDIGNCRRNFRSSSDCRRDAVTSRTSTALENGETARTPFECHQIACGSVVFLNTVRWRAFTNLDRPTLQLAARQQSFLHRAHQLIEGQPPR